MIFFQVVEHHVPIKQHRVKHKTRLQGMSSGILDEIKCRDRHKSVGNDAEYKIWRNKVIKLIHSSEKSQYQTFIDNSKCNQGSICKIFQDVEAGYGQSRQSTVTSLTFVGDTLIEDFTEKTNKFNNVFVNVASKNKTTCDKHKPS